MDPLTPQEFFLTLEKIATGQYQEERSPEIQDPGEANANPYPRDMSMNISDVGMMGQMIGGGAKENHDVHKTVDAPKTLSSESGPRSDPQSEAALPQNNQRSPAPSSPTHALKDNYNFKAGMHLGDETCLYLEAVLEKLSMGMGAGPMTSSLAAGATPGVGAANRSFNPMKPPNPTLTGAAPLSPKMGGDDDVLRNLLVQKLAGPVGGASSKLGLTAGANKLSVPKALPNPGRKPPMAV